MITMKYEMEGMRSLGVNRKSCECSGTANFTYSDIIFVEFEICPTCELFNNVFTYEDIPSEFRFEALEFRKPNCVFYENGAVLSVAGEGTATFGESTFDAVFSVHLLELENQNDTFIVIITSVDENGSPFIIPLDFQVADEELSISPCDEAIQMGRSALNVGNFKHSLLTNFLNKPKF